MKLTKLSALLVLASLSIFSETSHANIANSIYVGEQVIVKHDILMQKVEKGEASTSIVLIPEKSKTKFGYHYPCDDEGGWTSSGCAFGFYKDVETPDQGCILSGESNVPIELTKNQQLTITQVDAKDLLTVLLSTQSDHRVQLLCDRAVVQMDLEDFADKLKGAGLEIRENDVVNKNY